MIQCSGLYKKYNRKVALENVSVTLEKGKIYAFLGPNGSGKTTFMKILANLTEQSKGTVLFDGESLTVKSRAKIAYLPTESHAYPFMTVDDFGKYYAYFFKDFDRNRFQDWVERMQIPFQTPFKVLSSGMDKKVRVAATLARSAELLILDEPFNGVDLLAREEIEKMILESMTEEKTVILSSHLVEEVESYIDFALFFRHGSLIATEDVEKMRQESGKSLTDLYRELLAGEGM